MPKPLPSQDRLRELLDYEPLTGALVWKLSPSKNISAGTPAGSRGTLNNRTVKIEGERYATQRLIWKLVTGEDPPQLVDHKNGDFTDNSWTNLRLATHCQNNSNKRTAPAATGLPKGVRRHPSGRFWSEIRSNKQHHYLGTFDTPEEAHQAYCAAAADLHGEFAAA